MFQKISELFCGYFYFISNWKKVFCFVSFCMIIRLTASNLDSNIKMPFSIFHCQRNEFNIHHMECTELAKPNHVSLCSVSSLSAQREICNHFLILLLQKAEKNLLLTFILFTQDQNVRAHTCGSGLLAVTVVYVRFFYRFSNRSLMVFTRWTLAMERMLLFDVVKIIYCIP